MLTVSEVTKWMVNSGDNYCHSVKSHDSNAEVGCLDCGWVGVRSQIER